MIDSRDRVGNGGDLKRFPLAGNLVSFNLAGIDELTDQLIVAQRSGDECNPVGRIGVQCKFRCNPGNSADVGLQICSGQPDACIVSLIYDDGRCLAIMREQDATGFRMIGDDCLWNCGRLGRSDPSSGGHQNKNDCQVRGGQSKP